MTVLLTVYERFFLGGIALGILSSSVVWLGCGLLFFRWWRQR